jgi:hypothetical protein
VDPGNASVPSDEVIFCFNCHRRDVYGDTNLLTPGNEDFARVPHGTGFYAEDSRTYLWYSKADDNEWPWHCANCHGADKMGSLHGTNQSNGIRFLNGASWGGDQTGNNNRGQATTSTLGKCYANNAGSETAYVGTCGSHSSGSPYGANANYDYFD